MFDLRDLEKRLQSDPNLRKQFLDDPVGSLRKEGVTLTPEFEKHIEDHMKHVRARKAGGVQHESVKFGISIDPGGGPGNPPGPGVSVGVTVEY